MIDAALCKSSLLVYATEGVEGKTKSLSVISSHTSSQSNKNDRNNRVNSQHFVL